MDTFTLQDINYDDLDPATAKIVKQLLEQLS